MGSAIPPVPPALPPVIRQTPPPLPPPAPPKAGMLRFYRCWCGLFVLIYLGMATHFILVARGTVEPSLGLIESALSHENPAVGAEIIGEKRADAPGVAGFTIAVALLYAAAACIPRQPWAWTFGLVMICTTVFPFIITIAGTLPLLLQWASPAGKLYFRKRP